MPGDAVETAIGEYLQALKDPEALRDHDRIDHLTKQLHDAEDPLERIRYRQELLDAQDVSLDRYEEAFVTHARRWAERTGVTVKAFADEGVPASTLRKAGFPVRGRAGRAAIQAGGAQRRSRVTTDQVRAAIPDGPFTVKALQQASGASPAVVRKVVAEAEASGLLRNEGTDPSRRGPGRAATIYRRP